MQLAAHLHACRDNGQIVLLDLRRNRYWGLPTAAFCPEGVLVRGLPAGGDRIGDIWVERLLARGDLIEGDARVPVGDAARPTRKAMLPGAPRSTFRNTISFFRSCLWADGQVRAGTLDKALAELARFKTKAQGDHARSCAAWFIAQRPWFPHERVCLFDSLALARYALSAGQACELVFAVRARPFAAHCWVEHQGETLNDYYDTHASFTPILRV